MEISKEMLTMSPLDRLLAYEYNNDGSIFGDKD